MIQASVYIICKNEEKHIKRALESVKDFAEIVVVDSGSTDKTVDIAKRYTTRVHYQEWQGFSKQKAHALSLCKERWVLNLDADEVISEELKKEIVQLIDSNNADGLDVKISSQFLGQFNHKYSKFNRRIRFFKKDKGYYEEKLVHESIKVTGKIMAATGFIFDYGTVDLSTHLAKINEYSTLRAKEKSMRYKKASKLKLICIFPMVFVKSYLFKRGFLNGTRGLIAAVNNAFYAFLKEAKLYEINKRAVVDKRT